MSGTWPQASASHQVSDHPPSAPKTVARVGRRRVLTPRALKTDHGRRARARYIEIIGEERHARGGRKARLRAPRTSAEHTERSSFRWEGDKKVGTGWGELPMLLSDGDGILYAVTPHVEGSAAIGLAPGMGSRQPSGDELRWYHHLGQADGSFRWEGPRKIGIGWGGLKHLFSGGGQSPGVAVGWRCGVEDPFNTSIHIASAGAASGRWSHLDLTYRADATNANMTQQTLDLLIRDAFDRWEAVSPLRFTKTTGAADITLQFGGQSIYEKFGARGGVQGAANPPESGVVMFDQSEPWNPGSLIDVAVHEIGHALGLDHSTSRTSIMYPYGPSVPIDPETIEAINGLYGWQPQEGLDDRGSTEGPSLATAGAASLAVDETCLYMAWRGPQGDDGVYWSVFDGDSHWSSQAAVSRAGSTHGPALASYPAIRADGTPATGLIMAWKGGPGDATVYWSRLDGTWSTPTPIAGRGTSDGPALAVLNDRLYMFWKGIDGDSDAYFAWLDNQPNAIWQVQQKIAYTEAVTEGMTSVSIGTSSQLGATAQGSAVLLAWKGAPGDNALYFSRLRNDDWTGQMPIPGVGSASGPSAAMLKGRTYLAWRGLPGDTGIYYTRL